MFKKLIKKNNWDILSEDLQEMIKEHCAAIIIQERMFKIFYKNHGPQWKKKINPNAFLIDLDYYCYLRGINDPWYDYCDDPLYTY